MLPRALAWTVFVIALPAAAGCGGDSGPDPAEVHKAYVAEVNALCKKVTEQSRPTNRKIKALLQADGTYASRLRKGAPLLVDTYERQAAKIERFKEIEPPEDDREQIAALTTVAEAALQDLEDGIPAARSGDLPPIIDLATDASGNRSKAERLGADYGLRADCFNLPIELQ